MLVVSIGCLDDIISPFLNYVITMILFKYYVNTKLLNFKIFNNNSTQLICMPKLTVMITKEIDDNLRDYIARKYPRESYGKLSEITINALKEYIENHP